MQVVVELSDGTRVETNKSNFRKHYERDGGKIVAAIDSDGVEVPYEDDGTEAEDTGEVVPTDPATPTTVPTDPGLIPANDPNAPTSAPAATPTTAPTDPNAPVVPANPKPKG